MLQHNKPLRKAYRKAPKQIGNYGQVEINDPAFRQEFLKALQPQIDELINWKLDHADDIQAHNKEQHN